MSKKKKRLNPFSNEKSQGGKEKALWIVNAAMLAAHLYHQVRKLQRRFTEDLARQITTRDIAGDTVVELHHEVSAGNQRLLFTTEVQRFSDGWFPVSRRARSKVRATAEHQTHGVRKGRVIYAVDLRRGEVMAAVAYHLPRRTKENVLVTAFLVRHDDQRLAPAGFVLAYLAKRYIHALARKCGHPADLHFVADDHTMSVDLGLLGFPPVEAIEAPDGLEIRFQQIED